MPECGICIILIVSLSPLVELKDVNEASRLLRSAIRESATDPKTGLIDMDLLTTGMGVTTRHQLNSMKEEIKRLLLNNKNKSIAQRRLLQELAAQSDTVIVFINL